MKIIKTILNTIKQHNNISYLKESFLELPFDGIDYYRIKLNNGYVVYIDFKLSGLRELFFKNGLIIDDIEQIKGNEVLETTKKINHRYYYHEDKIQVLIKKPIKIGGKYRRIVDSIDDLEKVKIKNFIVENGKFKIVYKNKIKNIVEIMEKERFEELFC